MRHGQSKANLQEIIISHPENGLLADYALTEKGREQARASAELSKLPADTVIYSSDFSRAKETAEIVRQTIEAKNEVRLTKALRERHFGTWEKKDHKHYHDVWASDKHSADHTTEEVESVNSVLSRTTRLVLDIENQYAGKNILLVSHGDCLQILQTGFQKTEPSKHRSIMHLETAEIRQMTLASN